MPTVTSARPLRPMGAHMPTSGGIANALSNGRLIGCSAVQVFTSSPRQWQYRPLEPELVEAFHTARDAHEIGFTVAHDSYLINLAAPNTEILQKSREAFRAELDRAEELRIPWVVTHMGAALESSEDAALDLLVESALAILRETEGMQVGIAMETTAGQGSSLGYTFEQIARVLDGAGRHPRLGVCLDTCHIFVAGYDIRTQETYEATFASFDSAIGFDRLKVIHANDAKKPLGSRVDRHEHIGEGELGDEPFRMLLGDSRLSHIPVVVETPDADSMHEVNVRRLHTLQAGDAVPLRVIVRLFGHFGEICPGELTVEAPQGSTPTGIANLLMAKHPRLTGLGDVCRAAINEEYAPADAPLAAGDTVAFIPPMSGG